MTDGPGSFSAARVARQLRRMVRGRLRVLQDQPSSARKATVGILDLLALLANWGSCV
ncbi:MAG: hypothetical protein ACE10B_05615 [Phycisphaerales bacterium]